MTNDVMTYEAQNLNRSSDFDIMGLSVEKMIARIEKLNEVVKRVMVNGVHYGVVPGAPKPFLWKAGAELLACVFRLVPECESNVVLDDPALQRSVMLPDGWIDDPSRPGKQKKAFKEMVVTGYYEVISTCRIRASDGSLLATASGTCNNCENKFNNQTYYDAKNNVLKRAEKRAMVSAILMATGASGLFLEEDDNVDHPSGGGGGSQGNAASSGNNSGTAGGWLTDPQKKLLWAKGSKLTPPAEKAVIECVIDGINRKRRAEGKTDFDAIASGTQMGDVIWQKARDWVARQNATFASATEPSSATEDSNMNPPPPPPSDDQF